jgi:ribosomal protein S8
MTVEEINQLDQFEIPRFSVFAKDQLPMPGIKKRINDVLNREIFVVDFKVTQSKRREGTECLQLQFKFNNEICVLFTGSHVLIDQLRGAENKGIKHFYATIVKIDNYFSFS